MARIVLENINNSSPSTTINWIKGTYQILFNVELDADETISVMNVFSSVGWLTIKEKTYYYINYDVTENNTINSRRGFITINITTNKDTFSKVVIINQSSFEILPIWADKFVRIETSLNYVSYNIKHNNNIIYGGKAYIIPNTNYVEIDISKICSSYIDSSMESAFNAPQDFNTQNGIGLFSLYVNDELYSSYLFYNSYSYKGNPPYIYHNNDYFVKLSEPIRNVYDSRQYIIYSFFNATNTSSYDITFYFHKEVYTHSSFTGSCLGRTEYTTLAKAPEGFDMAQFFSEYIPIKKTCCKYCLYYQNALGGWDSFLINGNDKQTDKITSYKYIKAVNNTTRDFGTKKYLNVINSTYKLYTDYLTDDEASRMYHLLESTEVYLHNLEDDTIIPVNITNNTCEYKTFSNNGKKKFYYEIDVEFAQHKIRQ